MTSTNPLNPGEVLEGRYRIGARIGDGAYAVVHEAQGPDGRFVAVKALLPNAEAIDPSAVARFRREMKLAAELRHPNIVEVLDWGQTVDGRLFLVMERLEGHSLLDVMYQEPFSEESTRHVVCQVLSALNYAHVRGFVHRDIKPSNVFLCSPPISETRSDASSGDGPLAGAFSTGAASSPPWPAVRAPLGSAGVYGVTLPLVEPGGGSSSTGGAQGPHDTIRDRVFSGEITEIDGPSRAPPPSTRDTGDQVGLLGRHREHGFAPDEDTRVKLLDFGLSKGIFGKRITFNSDLTSAGMMVGTPGYIAPEQLGDVKTTTPQMDLYAVGLLGYELLTAEPAFQGTGVMAMFQQLTQDPEPPPEWIRQMGIFPVIERLMARDTEERYRHAADALWDLRCVLDLPGR